MLRLDYRHSKRRRQPEEIRNDEFLMKILNISAPRRLPLKQWDEYALTFTLCKFHKEHYKHSITGKEASAHAPVPAKFLSNKRKTLVRLFNVK